MAVTMRGDDGIYGCLLSYITAEPPIAVYPVNGGDRAVIGAKRRGASIRRRRRMRSRIAPFLDQLPPPHERHPGQRDSAFPSIQARPLRVGDWCYGTRHRSGQKRDIHRNQVDRTLLSRNDVPKGT